MPTNFYFQSGNTPGTTNEQRLLEDLIIESIKIYGHDVYYLPRTTVKQDNILGEDVLSFFDTAYPIEMYLQNVQGWDGNSEIFTKFGISVTDQATFVVSKRRWEDSVSANDNSGLQLPTRPAEGDLIYFAKTKSMFEIKYVQHLDPFYQLGKFHIYSMNCELYQYSSEVFDTEISEIDAAQGKYTMDQLEFNVQTEAGDLLLTENGFSIILEQFSRKTQNPFSDNDDFASGRSDILDFTEVNPFGEY
jgi:hypothetical protein